MLTLAGRNFAQLRAEFTSARSKHVDCFRRGSCVGVQRLCVIARVSIFRAYVGDCCGCLVAVL